MSRNKYFGSSFSDRIDLPSISFASIYKCLIGNSFFDQSHETSSRFITKSRFESIRFEKFSSLIRGRIIPMDPTKICSCAGCRAYSNHTIHIIRTCRKSDNAMTTSRIHFKLQTSYIHSLVGATGINQA